MFAVYRKAGDVLRVSGVFDFHGDAVQYGESIGADSAIFSVSINGTLISGDGRELTECCHDSVWDEDSIRPIYLGEDIFQPYARELKKHLKGEKRPEREGNMTLYLNTTHLGDWSIDRYDGSAYCELCGDYDYSVGCSDTMEGMLCLIEEHFGSREFCSDNSRETAVDLIIDTLEAYGIDPFTPKGKRKIKYVR